MTEETARAVKRRKVRRVETEREETEVGEEEREVEAEVEVNTGTGIAEVTELAEVKAELAGVRAELAEVLAAVKKSTAGVKEMREAMVKMGRVLKRVAGDMDEIHLWLDPECETETEVTEDGTEEHSEINWDEEMTELEEEIEVAEVMKRI